LLDVAEIGYIAAMWVNQMAPAPFHWFCWI